MNIKKELFRYILAILRLFCLDRFLSDEVYQKMLYRRVTGYKLELDPPRTYTQKLQWIKLYDRKPIYRTMVDKYAVKQYAAKIIGDDHIVPLLGVWERPEDIDWDSLPNQFVLKTNHDCGGLVICKDKSKLDIETACKKLKKSLKRNYWLAGREWPYKDVPRKIIAEKYIEDSTGGLVDYKVMCFNGEPKLIEVHLGRYTSNHTQDFYNIDWEKTEIAQKSSGSVSDSLIEKPVCYDKMIELSRKLSTGIPHVRVDWYIVDNHLYLGELTFFDASGFDEFIPDKYNYIIGEWITLPAKTV